MATLEKQYTNYLKDNSDSTFTFDQWKEWHGNSIRQALIQIMKDDEELGLYDETSKCACGQNPSCKCETKQETLGEIKDLSYWKANAQEDYLRVPISVLRYICELETKMYSEEDLEVAFIEGRESSWSFNDWFEHFKNK